MVLARVAAALLVATALTVGAAACGGSRAAQLDRGGVTVSARLVRQRGGLVLKTTLKPDKKGFHLYSTTLPDGGVNGLGAPTRVVPGQGLRATGAVRADRPIRNLHVDQVGADLPVFPPGEVTISQAVVRVGQAPATVMVSYGACSDKLCLPPVQHASVRIDT